MKLNSKTVIFLWSHPGSYLINILEVLSSMNYKIFLVYWDRVPVNQLRVSVDSTLFTSYRRSDLSNDDVYNLLDSERPFKVVASGWMDLGYLTSIFRYKNKFSQAKTYCAIDDQWKGTIKQHVGRYVYKFILNRFVFDYMWVAGQPQLYYACKFGVKYNKIISGLLVASNSFNQVSFFEKRFVFVGRLVDVKNIQLLIKAHKKLNNSTRYVWKLIIIGEGPLLESILESLDENIIYRGSLYGVDLAQELNKGGVGCCISHHEPWGVVVQEFCLNGMPLILSDVVGSGSEFLINGLNGFLFKSNSVDDLFECMRSITELSTSEITEFSINSKRLSLRVNHKDSLFKFLNHSL